MNRRKFIASIGAVTSATLAGCDQPGGGAAVDDGNLNGTDSNNTSDTNNSTTNNTDTSQENVVSLNSHNFSYDSVGDIDATATVENLSSEEQSLSVIFQLYNDNVLIEETTANFFDIPAETITSEGGWFYEVDQQDVQDVTHYRVLVELNSFSDGYAAEVENSGDTFRSKLESS